MKKRIHINENDIRNIVREALENANYSSWGNADYRDDHTLTKDGIAKAINNGKKLICANCGTDDIMIKCTVNPNNGFIISVDSERGCKHCGNWAGLRIADKQ